MNSTDIDILARTIFGEARGEYGRIEGGLASLIAVGNVAMNRLKVQGWYGLSISEICQKPFQFSCWNKGDPNRPVVMQVDRSDPLFRLCQDVAEKVVPGLWPDLTKGSDHYHSAFLAELPSWAEGKRAKVRIAGHVFYQLTKGG